ncbi:MAG: hypothetical protein Q9M36_06805 [Sulfurovum sp.]|nr:hypothetical protein [Sulfurovum sp.]
MASRTAKGKEVRAYFIAVEKAMNEKRKEVSTNVEMHGSDISSILALMTAQNTLMEGLIKTQQESLVQQGKQTNIILDLIQDMKATRNIVVAPIPA